MSVTSTIIIMTEYFHGIKELKAPISCPIAVLIGDDQVERANSIIEALVAKGYLNVTYKAIANVSVHLFEK